MPATHNQYARRGVVGVIAREGRFLVIRRSRHVIAPGKLCFPGGGIEPNETPAEALVREFQEELAVDIEPIRLDWQSVTPWNVHIQWWLANMSPEQSPQANPLEVEEVLYLTWPEMLAHPDMLESNLAYLHRGQPVY